MWLGNPKAVLLLSGTVGSRDSHKVIRMLLSLYLSPLPSSVLTSLLVGLGLLSHCSDSLQSHKASGLLLSSPHICASNPPKALWPWMSREPLNSSPKLKWVCMRVGGCLLIDSTVRAKQNKGSWSAPRKGGGAAPKEQASSAAANSVVWMYCNQFPPSHLGCFQVLLVYIILW